MVYDTEFIDSNLQDSIADAVQKFANQKELEGIKSLSRYNPKKVGLILYLFSQGVSQTQMVRKYNLSHSTIKHTINEYANHTSRWRQLGAKINSRLFLELSSLEEDLVDSLRDQMEKREIKPTFRDLLPVTIALEKAERQANRASEGQEPQPERRVVTQQDYDDTLAAAKARMAELKKKEGAKAVGLAVG